MRFFEGGPSIPDDLLIARDEGRVVFFCGAGVSACARLPDFYGLAEWVLEKLRAELGMLFMPDNWCTLMSGKTACPTYVADGLSNHRVK